MSSSLPAVQTGEGRLRPVSMVSLAPCSRLALWRQLQYESLSKSLQTNLFPPFYHLIPPPRYGCVTLPGRTGR
jgi:hypothetical protein